MANTANFFDLFTASIVQGDLQHLSTVKDFLLDPFEIDAKAAALKHLKKHGIPPSATLAAKDDDMSACMVKSSPYKREPLHVVLDMVLEKLKGRLIERKHVEFTDEFRDTGVYPMAKQVELMTSLAAVGVKGSSSYFDLDRDEMYNLTVLEDQVDFGFEYIDEALGGVMNGEVCLLAARTGVGKSVVVCYNAVRWARQGKRVMVVSMEMGPKQLAHRMDAMLGHFNPKIFRKKTTPKSVLDGYRFDVMREMEEIQRDGGDIIFPSAQTISPQDLVNHVRRILPDILIVDGVYLLTPEGKYAASWEATKAASNSLKQSAMSLNIPVFATSQFKRAGKEDGFSLEDLAYSDALGQDADSVLSMTKEDDGMLLLSVIKNRNGETHGGSRLKLDWSTMRLEEEPWTKTTIKLGKT